MGTDLERAWYVAATVDFRVTLDPKKPVTYWLVTYRAPDHSIETRFVHEQIGGKEPDAAYWQKLVREHCASRPV